MNIRPWLDEEIAEMKRQQISEVTLHIVKPSGITEIYIMSKREARELGYVRENEVCLSELRILEGV